ncbi:MAG: bifunctional oligoribonuclease/PAP phosphatase NrnA [Proteobacteria bacterium]|nr:bifunctional oligoribonuclease/PAP phosphatase NrnA [Pseudomonadota bacterium]
MISHLKNAETVLLASHIHPDGDAIGSLVALGLALSHMGKKVTLFNECPVPKVYRFIEGVDNITMEIDDFHTFDTAIILDCADLVRIGDSAKDVAKIPVLINIDHHATNTGFGNFKKIETTACATAEIVYDILKILDIPISVGIAEAIYVGVLTDTGSFRFSNTTKEAFDISKEMVSLGANPYKIADHIYGTYSLGSIKLLHKILGSIEVSKNGKLSVLSLTLDMIDETGTHPEDIIGLVHYAKHIKDVKVAALIQEAPATGKCDNGTLFHVSLRSDGSVDVGVIASNYGGGGHPNSAGFSTKLNYLDLKKQMFKYAETM